MSATIGRKDYANQQALVAALVARCRFPHAARSVRLVETHISWVLLAGRYAYKIKKAVDLGFLDFTDLEARRFFCEEELRLNRRLAPQIYLDVVAIGGKPDAPEWGALPAIEYAVKMRRFAAANEFDRLLERGKLEPRHMDDLAAAIAAFHDGLPPVAADAAFGTAAAIRAAAMQNFEQMLPLLVEPADRDAAVTLGRSTAQVLAACETRFIERRAGGRVRECHGDLHLGNVVLIGDRPVPFDGIEFNPAFRWIDVIDEAAFLAMDLLHGRRPDLAWRFLNAYLEATGDYAGVPLLRFYLAYRATVRAKVSAIRASQPGQGGAICERELADCRDYLALAADCLVPRRPALIITHGLPGSGKSTFALAAVERLGALRIRSDVERKRLFGLGPLDDSRSGQGAGIYGAEATQRTYARLLELAQGLLEAGQGVVVDAAFLMRHEREQFFQLAQRMSVPFVIASLQGDPAVLEARVARRRSAGRDASEADAAVLRMLQTAQQPLSTQEVARVAEFPQGARANGAAAGWRRLNQLLAAAIA